MSDLFDFKAPSNQYAVMGNPVAHSKSPRIHTMFAEQLGVNMDYQRVQVDIGGFKQAVSHFAAHRGAGLNITVPFKVEAWDLCQRRPHSLSARAATAEAVNTLKFESDQTISGDNTDGIGLVTDLTRNLGIEIEQRRLLVIGAGGAVRGMLGPLLECKPASLHIVNRTASKAGALVERFRNLGFEGLSWGGLDDLKSTYDLVINGTAASLGGDIPTLSDHCIEPSTAAYDLMYAIQPTPFMQWAEQAGASLVSDGLGMLVEQAAASFQIWHHKRPDTAPVIAALRGPDRASQPS